MSLVILVREWKGACERKHDAQEEAGYENTLLFVRYVCILRVFIHVTFLCDVKLVWVCTWFVCVMCTSMLVYDMDVRT